MLGRLLSLGARGVIAVLALMLGLVAPAYAGPPASVPPVAIQPAAPDDQSAQSIRVYLITNRAVCVRRPHLAPA